MLCPVKKYTRGPSKNKIFHTFLRIHSLDFADFLPEARAYSGSLNSAYSPFPQKYIFP